jgi:hypothetical protein
MTLEGIPVVRGGDKPAPAAPHHFLGKAPLRPFTQDVLDHGVREHEAKALVSRNQSKWCMVMQGCAGQDGWDVIVAAGFSPPRAPLEGGAA